MSGSFSTVVWLGHGGMKAACAWPVLSEVRDTGQGQDHNQRWGCRSPGAPLPGSRHVAITCCGGAVEKLGCTVSNIFLPPCTHLPPASGFVLLRPVSRFLAASGARSAHFTSIPVHVSSPFSRITAPLRKPIQSPSMEPWPMTPDCSELTLSAFLQPSAVDSLERRLV